MASPQLSNLNKPELMASTQPVLINNQCEQTLEEDLDLMFHSEFEMMGCGISIPGFLRQIPNRILSVLSLGATSPLRAGPGIALSTAHKSVARGKDPHSHSSTPFSNAEFSYKAPIFTQHSVKFV